MNSSENQVKRLTADDIEIPAGMWNAVISDGRIPGREQGLVRASLNLALLWLAENPQMPKLEWLRETIDSANSTLTTPVLVGRCIAEWQRIMFRRKQDVLPELKGEWPESTCVECGRGIPAGMMQDCTEGGVCTWRVPKAIRKAMRKEGK